MNHAFGLGDIVFFIFFGFLALGSISAAKEQFDSSFQNGLLQLLFGIAVCWWLWYSHSHLPAGYLRNHDSFWPYAKVWQPGLTDPNHPHVISADQQGQWHPDYGYTWINGGEKDLSVSWTVGVERSDFANVYSSKAEGYWLAKPGYEFTAADGSTGYEIVSGNQLPSVTTTWSVGKSHPVCDNIQASSVEGRWTPKNGYQFVSSDSLTVRHVVYTSDASASPDLSGELLVGAPACIAAVANKGEGVWGALSKFVEEKVCEAAVESGAQKLGSNNSKAISEDIPCDFWNGDWHHDPVELK